MSIYINGMEMPNDCNHCRFAVDGWCYAYGKPNIDALANDGITNWCPLIPVPDHGRLIDAYALEVELLKRIENIRPKQGYDYAYYAGGNDRLRDVIRILRHLAPTIIPDDGKDGEE